MTPEQQSKLDADADADAEAEAHALLRALEEKTHLLQRQRRTGEMPGPARALVLALVLVLAGALLVAGLYFAAAFLRETRPPDMTAISPAP